MSSVRTDDNNTFINELSRLVGHSHLLTDPAKTARYRKGFRSGQGDALAVRQALPEVQVELVASNQVTNLLRREADIALRMVRPDQASLVAKRIGAVTLGAYAHRDYLRRKGTPRQPPDLLQHELVGNDRHEDIQQGFAAMGYPVERQHFAFRTDDLMAYWEAVRAGLGIGFVGNYMARTDPNVVAVLPQLPLPDLPIWLTVHREIRTSRKIRAVYDFLASEVPLVL